MAGVGRTAILIFIVLAGCASGASVSGSLSKEGLVRVPTEQGLLLRHSEENRPPNTQVLLFVQAPGTPAELTWGKIPELLATDPRWASFDVGIMTYSSGVKAGSDGIETAARELGAFVGRAMGRYGQITLIAHGPGAMVARKAVLLGSEAPRIKLQLARLVLIDPASHRSAWIRTCPDPRCAERPPDAGAFTALEEEWTKAGMLDLPTVVFMSPKIDSEKSGAPLKASRVVVLDKDALSVGRIGDRMSPWLDPLRLELPVSRAGGVSKTIVLVYPLPGDRENEFQHAVHLALKTIVKDAGLGSVLDVREVARLPEIGGSENLEETVRGIGRREKAGLLVWGTAEGDVAKLHMTRLSVVRAERPFSERGMPESAPIRAFARIPDDIPLPPTGSLPPLGIKDFPSLGRLLAVGGLHSSGLEARALAELEAGLPGLEGLFPVQVPIIRSTLLLSLIRSPLPMTNLDEAIGWLEKVLEHDPADASSEWSGFARYALGRAYWRRARGIDPEDLKRSAGTFEGLLRVWTKEGFQQGYARAQRGLGDALTDLSLGSTRKDLSPASQAYDAALSVWTEADFPYEHAATSHAKALAFLHSAEAETDPVERARGLNTAVTALGSAGSLFKRESDPVAFAASQYLLGRIYAARAAAQGGEDFKNAAASYRSALAVISDREDPAANAFIQSELGQAYWRMPTGDINANLSKAVEAHTRALAILVPETRPIAYATTLERLGLTYADLPTGNRAESLSKASESFRAVIPLWEALGRKEDSARVRWQLAKAYLEMPGPDRGASLQQAVEVLEQALTTYTREAFPELYARIQTQLAMAQWLKPASPPGEGIRQAIVHYGEALRVYTRRDYPISYAATQNNLGLAYLELPVGDRAENLAHAVEAFEQGLSILTRNEHPFQYAVTKYNIALAYWMRAERGPGRPDPVELREMNRHIRDFIEAFPYAYFAYHDQGERFLMSSSGEDLQMGATAVADRLFHLWLKFREFARQRPDRFQPELRAQLEIEPIAPEKPEARRTR